VYLEFARFAGNPSDATFWNNAQAEQTMNYTWSIAAIAALGLLAADPALARSKHKAKAACADQPVPSVMNGLGPPVYAYGKYVGHDPDPNIRLQLLRDPATGYSAHQN
jgi:hypothetical protein